jgi:hypothetical protein
MSGDFTVYTVTTGDGNERWTAGVYTSEAAAETTAEGLNDAEITASTVPLPDLTVVVRNGAVEAITTTDGIMVEAEVRDYDTDGLHSSDVETDPFGDTYVLYGIGQ